MSIFVLEQSTSDLTADGSQLMRIERTERTMSRPQVSDRRAGCRGVPQSLQQLR